MALCAGVATITLTFGMLRSLPAAARRLSAVHIPFPARSIATLLMMTSVLGLLVRPRPSAATVPPPIVRLADSALVRGGVDEPPVPAPASSEATAPGGPASPIRAIAADSHGDTYVVRAGDSLWRIAERTLVARNGDSVTSADIAQFWPVVYQANRALIGADPNLIFPGQTLQLPEV